MEDEQWLAKLTEEERKVLAKERAIWEARDKADVEKKEKDKRDKINKINAAIRELNAQIWEEQKHRNKMYHATHTDLEWKNWFLERSRERQKEFERQLKRFEFLKKQAQGKPLPPSLKIEEAREFPIGDLLPTNPQPGRRAFYRCPLHNEKTGSFCWYKKENKWWCYGESKGGDVIDLYMQMNNCDFKSAVKHLTR